MPRPPTAGPATRAATPTTIRNLPFLTSPTHRLVTGQSQVCWAHSLDCVRMGLLLSIVVAVYEMWAVMSKPKAGVHLTEWWSFAQSNVHLHTNMTHDKWRRKKELLRSLTIL